MSADSDFNLRYMISAFRRRLWIFLLCVVLIPGAAVGLSFLQKKQYTARAELLFRDPEFDQKLFGTSFVQNQPDPTRQAATNLGLVSLPRVAALTAAQIPGLTENQVSSAIGVSSDGQSDLVSIQATARTPGFAAELANTFGTQYIAFRRDADRATIFSAEVPLQQQIAALPKSQRFGPLGQSLQQRLSQLGVLASLQTGDAELVQPAEVPRGPSSPQTVRNGALGAFFGVLLAVALVLIVEALDRRVRDSAEVEQIFERPLLAAMPESAAIRRADPALLAIPAAQREAFRMLWVNLRYFSLSRDIRSVLVTSPDRDDGKSTVSWGLAVAAASSGTRTLLIEADLRKPSFASRFDLPARDGLTSVLAGDVPSAQAIMRLPLPITEDTPGTAHSMDVLVSGPRPPDPTDLLQSHRMADFLAWLEDHYDLIIIDTPPAAMVSDAIPLITMVHGVIVVSRLGNTVRDHARRLRQQLHHLDAPILGIVVNSVGGDGPYQYPYADGYGDTGPKATPRHNGTRPVSEEPSRARPAGRAVPANGAKPDRGTGASLNPALTERRGLRDRLT
ncbi:MAG: polysaccharide biosynthesis tyrosine autokinase [Solirubrobacterales bacterium]|nr:polysaccharide biosynthesis tyrosine autokinase [Solirubrobacterales bacterium]